MPSISSWILALNLEQAQQSFAQNIRETHVPAAQKAMQNLTSAPPSWLRRAEQKHHR